MEEVVFSFYQIYWLFIAFAFIGWCVEVAYATVKTSSFVNRGFLNGPVCPIYGFGVVIVTLLLMPLRDHWLLLFICAVLLTSCLEFITGYILEKIFHQKWWDYSEIRWNIKGYVCPRFSLMWGVGCLAVIYLIEPPVLLLINGMPKVLGIILLCAVSAIFAADLSVTAATLLKINARFKRMNDTEERLRRLSDELGESISKRVGAGVQLYEKHAADLNAIKEKAELIFNEKHFGAGRLNKAFPNLNRKVAEREERIQEKVRSLLSKIRQNQDENVDSVMGNATSRK